MVDVTGGDVARDLTVELRAAGLAADRAFDGRSVKAQRKAADRSGARFAVIVGEDEAAARARSRSGTCARTAPRIEVPRRDLADDAFDD